MRTLPEDLEDRLAALAERWAADRDVAAAYLYGSRARGEARPGSDVDLAVILRAGLSGSERWGRCLELIDEAASCLGTDAVDVIVLEEVPSAVGHRVVRDGRLLCERDGRRRVAVVEDILRRYLDEAPLRRMLDEGLKQRLREGRFAR